MASNFIADFYKGQSVYASTLRLLVLKEDEQLFSLLNYNDDRVFLEPYLFLYYNQKENGHISLWQALFTYLEERKLPASIEVTVSTNRFGNIFIPGKGYLITELKNKKLMLRYEKNHKKILLSCNNKDIKYQFSPSVYLSGGETELYQFNDDAYQELYNGFRNEMLTQHYKSFSAKSLYSLTKEKINKAYRFLKLAPLNYKNTLLSATKSVFSCTSQNMWSFSDKAAHGLSFICGKPSESIIFFICELAHQGGHTVFNSILHDPEKIFLEDPATSMKKLTGDETDYRSLFGAFHGLFTTSKVAEILNYTYRLKKFREDLQYEALGRLVDNFYRHQSGLEKLSLKKVFTKKGLAIYHAFDNYLIKLYKPYKGLIKKYDLSNQDFVFDFEKFKILNPMQH